MYAIGSKKSLIVAYMGLLVGVQSCLEIWGSISSGLETVFNLKVYDNDVYVCKFGCTGIISDCEADCNDGYSAKIEGARRDSEVSVEYVNWDGGEHTVSVPVTENTCDDSCCPGMAPCSCCETTYSGEFFGC